MNMQNSYAIDKKSISSLLLFLGVGTGLIYSADPTSSGFGTSANVWLKFLPYILIFSGVVFIKEYKIKLNIATLLMIIFFFVMVGGSSYAYFVKGNDIQETYLSRSLGFFVFLASFVIFQDAKSLRLFINIFSRSLVAYSIYVSCIAVLYRLGIIFVDLPQVYQHQSVLLASAIVLILSSPNYFYKKALIMLFLVGLLAMAKTTSFVMAAISILYILYHYFGYKLVKIKASNEMKLVLSILVVTIFTLGAIFALESLYQDRLEDRNNDVRETFAQIRLNEFLDSPVVGNFYTGSPLLDYYWLHIPSHSEWLDMLSAAGLLAIALFFTPFLWLVYKARLYEIRGNRLGLDEWLGFSVSAFAISMAVNPTLVMPNMAVIFWMMLGGLAGLIAAKKEYTLIGFRAIKEILGRDRVFVKLIPN